MEIDPWEEAYRRFQSPEEEIRKFIRRLETVGFSSWSREARVAELFCGRGNGLRALQRLGFGRVIGTDLSLSQLASFEDRPRVTLADGRRLPFRGGCVDVVVLQGGLHHLSDPDADLPVTLSEISRVLRDGGIFVLVEPWSSPFLSFIHAMCRVRLFRWIFPKLDALATMIECEGETYRQWLGQGDRIRELLQRAFRPRVLRISWGKLLFVGERTPVGIP